MFLVKDKILKNTFLWLLKKVRDNGTVQIHSNKKKNLADLGITYMQKDVSNAVIFLMNYNLDKIEINENDLKCQKFNIVGKDEIDNLELAQFIANFQNKNLKYEMVDYHSSRPGHDLRYALDGNKMSKMGWKLESAYDRLESVIEWSLKNDRWL